MGKNRRWIMVVASTVLWLLTTAFTVFAVPLTMDFTYSSYGSGTASASGWITVDTANFANPTTTAWGQSDIYDTSAGLTAAILGLSITVTGASDGNGTYTIGRNKSDFSYVSWYTNGATLDTAWGKSIMGQQLYDQTFGFSTGFGTTGMGFLAGDLGLYGTGNAPTFYDYFILQAKGGDLMQLSSLYVPTPEPSSVMLFGSGLMGLGYLRRRFGYKGRSSEAAC